jgi:hypothetical protein
VLKFCQAWRMPEQLREWSLTSGIVVKHMHYGLRVQVPSGEIGVVDRVDIADGYIEPADCGVLSTRPSHLEEARNRAARGQQATSGVKGDSPSS